MQKPSSRATSSHSTASRPPKSSNSTRRTNSTKNATAGRKKPKKSVHSSYDSVSQTMTESTNICASETATTPTVTLPAIETSNLSLEDRVKLQKERQQQEFEEYEKLKRQYTAELQEQRHRNRDLRAKLAKMQKKAHMAESDQLHEETSEEKIESQVARARSHYDSLRAESASLTSKLNKLEKEHELLQHHAEEISNNPQIQKIRQLEEDLEQANIKYNEAQNIGTTYDQILKRLTDERVDFDNQLVAIREALEAKRKDLEELEATAEQAEYSKEARLTQLRQVQSDLKFARERREHEIRKAEKTARKKLHRKELQEERQRKRIELLLGRSEEGHSEEGQMNVELKDLLESEKSLRENVDAYEEDFRKLQHTTGAQTSDEIIRKVAAQHDQQKHLRELADSNSTKLQQVKDELEELQAYADKIKYNRGVDQSPERSREEAYSTGKQAFEDLEYALNEAQSRLTRGRGRYERLARVMVDLRAGIEHLAEKLEPIRRRLKLDLYGQDIFEQGEIRQAISDLDVVSLLEGCRNAIFAALREVGESEERSKSPLMEVPAGSLSPTYGFAGSPLAKAGQFTFEAEEVTQFTGVDRSSSQKSSRSARWENLTNSSYMEIRKRVPTPHQKRQADTRSDSESSDEGVGDVVSRRHIKHQARSNVNAKLRSMRRRALDKKEQEEDED